LQSGVYLITSPPPFFLLCNIYEVRYLLSFYASLAASGFVYA
jgi:hypothetical protein